MGIGSGVRRQIIGLGLDRRQVRLASPGAHLGVQVGVMGRDLHHLVLIRIRQRPAAVQPDHQGLSRGGRELVEPAADLRDRGRRGHVRPVRDLLVDADGRRQSGGRRPGIAEKDHVDHIATCLIPRGTRPRLVLETPAARAKSAISKSIFRSMVIKSW